VRVRHDGRSREFVRAKRTMVDWEIAGGNSWAYPASCRVFPGMSDLAPMRISHVAPVARDAASQSPFPLHCLTAFPFSLFALGQRRSPGRRHAQYRFPCYRLFSTRRTRTQFFFNFAATAPFQFTELDCQTGPSKYDGMHLLAILTLPARYGRIRSIISAFIFSFRDLRACSFFKFSP
jgi:hypothetical protein